MRKLKIKSPVILTIDIVIIGLSSCKDWLTVAPQDKLVKEKFWTKTEDVYSSLAATYDAMRGASLNSLILGEVRADLITFSGSTFSKYIQIGQSNISPTNGAVNWKDYYSAINLANTTMYYNKQVFGKDKTFTKEMLDGVDAECLFIRSLANFYLIRLWKDVPLVITPSISDTSNLYIEKSPENVVIQQIVTDLKKAMERA